jgi:predicted DNA binding protein
MCYVHTSPERVSRRPLPSPGGTAFMPRGDWRRVIRFQSRLKRDCHFCVLSSEYPEVRVSEWAGTRTHYLELGGMASAGVPAFRKRLRELVRPCSGPIRETHPTGGAPSLYMPCRALHRSPHGNTVDRMGGVKIDPIVYRRGWEETRSLFPDGDSLSRYIERMTEFGPFEVLQKRPIKEAEFTRTRVVPVDELLSDLTDRQRLALHRALMAGYFDLPRRIGIDEIVRGTGATRSTFGEHLHKAESKVLRALGPFLTFGEISDG